MRTITKTHLETSAASRLNSPTGAVDPFCGSMLGSAFADNGKRGLVIVLKVLFGMGGVFVLGILLHPWVALPFYGAWSAAMVLVYLANLADVVRLRDVACVLVPGLMIALLLTYGADRPIFVGLSLFTHVTVAFYAGLNQISGSLKDLGLWSVLFGVNGVVFCCYALQVSG